ncbi:MAG: hypothetical protein DHS20C15_22000 [Planctomycetota bacterium]|nr:MAG: hypothetical protein DHS20C15_22000 [Planctomycetota bacterium]
MSDAPPRDAPPRDALPRPARPGLWRRLRRRRGSLAALTVLLLFVLLAIGAPLLPLAHPAETNTARASQGPSPSWTERSAEVEREAADAHPWASAVRTQLFGAHALQGALGSDALGRDLAARIVWGARVSLAVALAATLVSVLLGVAYGVLAGFVGGRVDQVMMRAIDVLYSIPFLFLVILVVSVLRDERVAAAVQSWGLDQLSLLFLVIGAVSWLGMARLVRGQLLSLREAEFVTAARALGVTPLRLAWRHLLPHLGGIIVVVLTLTVPRVMLFEAFLSFLGLGVEPPGVSWGLLASDGLAALTPVSRSWWLVVFPGLALAASLFSLNLLGDALRDALDPRTGRNGKPAG